MAWAAGAPASAHVFVDRLGDTVDLDGADGHHLARVLRLHPGEEVTAADNSGTWRLYVVAAVAATSVRLEATGSPVVEPELSPRLAVAFALTKGHKPEFTIQKLTELGVDRILPVLSERSVARPDGDRLAPVHARWRRVALEAARQCRRARLPAVGELASLASLAGHPAVLVTGRGGGRAAALGPPPGDEILVIVGPEGGLTLGEVEALRPWARLGLGPHVLRAETAALAAAAVIGAVLQHERPRRRP